MAVELRGLADGDQRKRGRRRAVLHAGDGAAGVGDDQQFAGGFEGLAFGVDVGIFDAGPGLDEGDGTGAEIFGDGDQEALAGLVDDHAFVHQDVFLQRAFEVVAEGGIGTGGWEAAIIGLDEAALADLVMFDLVSDGDNPASDFVAGDRGFFIGDVAGDLFRRARILSVGRLMAMDRLLQGGWLGELFEEFEVGEAEADAFGFDEDFVRAGLEDWFGAVEFELAGADELDGDLGFGEIGHGNNRC